jgi:hypothetical protein
LREGLQKQSYFVLDRHGRYITEYCFLFCISEVEDATARLKIYRNILKEKQSLTSEAGKQRRANQTGYGRNGSYPNRKRNSVARFESQLSPECQGSKSVIPTADDNSGSDSGGSTRVEPSTPASVGSPVLPADDENLLDAAMVGGDHDPGAGTYSDPISKNPVTRVTQTSIKLP